MHLVHHHARAQRTHESAAGHVRLTADLLAEVITALRDYIAALDNQNSVYTDDLITERLSVKEHDLLTACNTRRIKELRRLAARLDKEGCHA